MKSISNRRIAIPVLVILAFIVWGHNGYRLIRGISSSDQDAVTAKMEGPSTLALVDSSWFGWEYPEKGRDPFQLPARHNAKTVDSSQKARVRKKASEPPSCPPLRLTGIIRDNDGPLAVLEGLAQEVHLVRPGQQVDSILVRAIREKSVTIEYRRAQFELKLE
jgi:hypothetical protein